MKNYLFNILISAVVCFVLAILTFLVGRDGGVQAAAVFAGVFYGIVSAAAYCFGGMMSLGDSAFDGKRLVAMLISGIVGGLLGGVLIALG